MSNFTYEFLSHEEITEDPYILHVVEVCINDVLILPYTKMKNKDGGTYWGFCGCSPLVKGTKKRFNGKFDSEKAKTKFNLLVEDYIAHIHQMTQPANYVAIITKETASTSIPYGSSPPNFPEGGYVDANLPF